MGDMEEERSILEALDPGQREEVSAEEAHSILLDINHIREHIETLEDAARAARASRHSRTPRGRHGPWSSTRSASWSSNWNRSPRRRERSRATSLGSLPTRIG